MSSEGQKSKDLTQDEERFWIDFDRQYFSEPNKSLVMCLKSHIWHTRHISSKISSYLKSKKRVKKTSKQNKALYLRSVKFPLRLLTYEKFFNTGSTNTGIFKYMNTGSTLSNEQIQGLLENDNIFKPMVCAKHDSNQRLPTFYSASLPDAIHLSVYVPPTSAKGKEEENKSKKDDKKGEKPAEVDESFTNFVNSFKSVQLLDNQYVPQIISGPTPSWFRKGKGRFKRGVDPGPRYKKCDKLIKMPQGLISDPVWQHFNTNYVCDTSFKSLAFPKGSTFGSEPVSDREPLDGTDLLNFHNMCDSGTCRVDYSPHLFSFVSSIKSPLCKRCLGFPKLSCNLCKNNTGSTSSIFSSQYVSDEKYHMTYNYVDLFKLRSTTNEPLPNYYANPHKTPKDKQFEIATKRQAEEMDNEEEEEEQLIHNYIQTLESINTVFSTLLNRVEKEYKPNKGNWHSIESKMLDNYIKQYKTNAFDNRYTYNVQRQSIDVLQLRLTVKRSSELPGTWTDRALCSICHNDDDWDDDPILFCDCCFIPMHFCCIGYKPGTLSEVKNKLNLNKLQRMNYFTNLSTSPEKMTKKLKMDKLDDLLDLDDDEWYCPVCSHLMDQLSFLDENLIMATIRLVGGPKNKEQLNMINETNSESTSEENKEDQNDEQNLDKNKEVPFSYSPPQILGFDYDHPQERVYVSVQQSRTMGQLVKSNSKENGSEEKGETQELNHELELMMEEETSLEHVSTLTVYGGKNEWIRYNTNNVSDPKTFCKFMLTRRGLYFEHSFWKLLSRANMTGIQDYLNYYSTEDLYLTRLVQQDKMVNEAKLLSKRRSASMTNKLASRSVSLNNLKDPLPVKREESVSEVVVPKKKMPTYESNTELNCKYPLKRLYMSINLLQVLSLCSTNPMSNKVGGPNSLVTNTSQSLKSLLNSNFLKGFKKHAGYSYCDDVDILIRIPVCIFCGFDAFFPGGGPMKKTSNSGTWGHIKCALSNDCIIEPDVINYATFVPKSKALKCIFCSNWSNSAIQCSYGNCCKAFHVPCASASSQCLFTWDSNGKPDVLCPIHSKGLAPTSLLRKLQLRLMNVAKEKEKDLKDSMDKAKQVKFGPKNKGGKNAIKKDKNKEKTTKKVKEKSKDKEDEESEPEEEEEEEEDEEEQEAETEKIKETEKEISSKNNVKPQRDLVENLSIAENLYLGHFLRPNYNNLSKLLELLLSQKVGTIFQSNLSSNYYNKQKVDQPSKVNNVSLERALSENKSNSSDSSVNEVKRREEEFMRDEDLLKDAEMDEDCGSGLVTPRPTSLDRFDQLNANSASSFRDYLDRDLDSVMDLDEPELERETKKESILKDAKQLLLGKEQLIKKHKEEKVGLCPMNNINANDCFWCCLGFDLSGHNKHVFDDKTPSSKEILSILYSDQLNVKEIKALIMAKYEGKCNYEDYDVTKNNRSNNTGTNNKSSKVEDSDDVDMDGDDREDEEVEMEDDCGDEKEGYQYKYKYIDEPENEEEEGELKIPWSILTSTIINDAVDDKINMFICNDLVNNNKLVRKNEVMINKLASEALVRLFNTFEPDTTKSVINTIFSMLKHIEFINKLDEAYGYNDFCFSKSFEAQELMEKKPEFNFECLNFSESIGDVMGNKGERNGIGSVKNIIIKRENGLPKSIQRDDDFKNLFKLLDSTKPEDGTFNGTMKDNINTSNNTTSVNSNLNNGNQNKDNKDGEVEGIKESPRALRLKERELLKLEREKQMQMAKSEEEEEKDKDSANGNLQKEKEKAKEKDKESTPKMEKENQVGKLELEKDLDGPKLKKQKESPRSQKSGDSSRSQKDKDVSTPRTQKDKDTQMPKTPSDKKDKGSDKENNKSDKEKEKDSGRGHKDKDKESPKSDKGKEDGKGAEKKEKDSSRFARSKDSPKSPRLKEKEENNKLLKSKENEGQSGTKLKDKENGNSQKDRDNGKAQKEKDKDRENNKSLRDKYSARSEKDKESPKAGKDKEGAKSEKEKDTPRTPTEKKEKNGARDSKDKSSSSSDSKEKVSPKSTKSKEKESPKSGKEKGKESSKVVNDQESNGSKTVNEKNKEKEKNGQNLSKEKDKEKEKGSPKNKDNESAKESARSGKEKENKAKQTNSTTTTNNKQNGSTANPKSNGKKEKGAKAKEKGELSPEEKEKADRERKIKEKQELKKEIFSLLKEVNNVEIIKINKYLLPSSILRKYIENKKITICKVCLEFKYIENEVDSNKRKRSIYNESYRKCIHCNVEVCNSCLSMSKKDLEHMTNNPTMVISEYVGREIDHFEFVCVRCKDLEEDVATPLMNCVLCSRYDGLMFKVNYKQLTFVPSKTSCWNGMGYVHLICLEWLYWSKTVSNVNKKLNKAYFDQSCNYCGMLTGATIACSNSTCFSRFHSSCAAFLGCKIDVGRKFENLVGVRRALCLRHTLISIGRSSMSERKFMVAPSYLYEILVNQRYFTTFFRGVYLSPNIITTTTNLANRFRLKKKPRPLDYKSNMSLVKMATYINYGLVVNKSPSISDLNLTDVLARERLIQGMNYVFYQRTIPHSNRVYNIFNKEFENKEKNLRDYRNIINLLKSGYLRPIHGSKRGRKPRSLDGSEVDKRHKMPMEDILRYGHVGVLENGEFYCPLCFSIYFENSPGLPGDDLHWIGCDKCERWFHFVCAGVWVDYRDKDSWYCYHCVNLLKNM